MREIRKRIGERLMRIGWRLMLLRSMPSRSEWERQRAQQFANEFARGYKRGWEECLEAWIVQAQAKGRPGNGAEAH
jgi:hypothetical protein